MNDTGIYKITNLVNEKVYVGKVTNFQSRKRAHLSKLRRGVHDNIHLQRSWDKYGESNFTIELIELCIREDLSIRENHWMNVFNSFKEDNGYNIIFPDESGNTYRHSHKTKEMISNSHKLYTDEELIEYLLLFYKEEGRVPTQRDLVNNAKYPNYGTYHNRFGSFKNALVQARLYDFIPSKSGFNRSKFLEKDKLEIIRIIRNFCEKNKKFIEKKDIDNHKSLPHSSTINKLFGSMDDLMKECGYTKRHFIEIENKIVLDNLYKLYSSDGMITRNTIEKCPYTNSYSFYIKRFGKLSNAYKLAGIPVNQYGHPISNKVTSS